MLKPSLTEFCNKYFRIMSNFGPSTFKYTTDSEESGKSDEISSQDIQIIESDEKEDSRN
jgi:hypothetical protein